MDSKTTESRAHYTPRLEDEPLVRGLGRYAADVTMTGQAYAYFVRSPHAFADIRSIDTTAAKAVPGVLAVLTAADMEEAKVGNISQHPPVAGRGGTKLVIPFRPALAGKTVRAHRRGGRSRGRRDARRPRRTAPKLVTVEYEERDARRRPARGRRTGRRAGLAGGARQYRGRLGSASRPIRRPMPRRSTAIIADAKHVARVSVLHQRIVVASMEPRGATASYDAANDSYFLRCCSQSARALRDGLATILGVPNPKLRVVTEDVGGAFGLKTGPYPEYLAILVAAKKIGRPVHWMSNRAEVVRQRQPRARRLFRRRTRARRARQVPGAAHPPPRQHGRLYRRGRRQHPDRQSRALPARHVRHQADRHRRPSACSPTRSPPRPIAAPAGRKRTTSSSA